MNWGRHLNSVFVAAIFSWGPAIAIAADKTGAHEELASPHGEVMEFELSAAVIQLILFVLVIIVLGKFVWPAILKGLQSREDKIRGDLERAEKANADANATLKQYELKLADAQKEANKMIERGRADAQRQASQLKEQAQVEIAAIKRRAESDILAAKQQCIAEIHEQTAALATSVATQILQREIKPDEHEDLVYQSLQQLTEHRS